MHILDTDRLRIRQLCTDDAAFILRLLNESSFLKNIGDRNVRSLEQSKQFLQEGPIASYQKYGHGLFHVALLSDNTAIGICGLLYREHIQETDIGFAYLPEFWGKGYSVEAAQAVLDWGRNVLGKTRIIGITKADNIGSVRTLEKIGLAFEKKFIFKDGEPESDMYA